MKFQDGSFTPISPNPYIVGNPVRDRHMFFGREAEFDLVKRRFVESRAIGGLLIFCGERRSGKTSILFQIDQGRLGPEFVPVLIDMQSMAVESEEDFLLKVGTLILDRMGLEARSNLGAIVGSKKPSAVFRELVQSALNQHPERKLILLFDEYELFENKIKEGTISEDVLHQLAHLTENRSVFLVFTGSLSLDERHQEYWKVFLGRSTFKKISFLERRDAVSLIIDPLRDRVHYEDGIVDSIYRLTAGQPFYTQAVCQSIVDQLNERQTNHVNDEILNQVVDGIVAQPFPQMTFRWEELDRNEKLILALLAESLSDSKSASSAKDLLHMLGHKRYPLRLGAADIAAALDSLFRKEILLVFEEAHLRSYAFRVDLWRHWVRRMHTVWQVMRELGMEIRPEEKRRRAVRRSIMFSAVAIAAFGLAWVGKDWFPREQPAGAPAAGSLSILTNLPDASISIDGKDLGRLGAFASSSFPLGDHRVVVSRKGYQSASFSLSVLSGASVDTTVKLNPLPGAIRVETIPAGAEVFLNDERLGKGPIEVRDLHPNENHVIRAELPGYGASIQTVTVLPDSMLLVRCTLSQAQAALVIRTEPSGATLFVDNVASGTTTKTLLLPLGKHRILVTHPGFLSKDTTCVVSGPTDLMLRLETRPKGMLRIQGEGNVYATMYVNNRLVQRSHIRWNGATFEEGNYQVRIDFDDPSRPDTSFVVPVQSGCETRFNYITGNHEIHCSESGSP